MRFQVIYADPPWHYPERRPGTRFGGGSSSQFNQMKLSELAALPVRSLADENAVLFMWGVWPKLFTDVGPLIKAWGFNYSGMGFVWVKVTEAGIPRTGPGSYTCSNSEPCFIAKKGYYQEPVQHLVQEIVMEPRRGYAEKPETVANRINLMYPELSKIELFARKERPGWTCIGNEISGREIIDDIEALTGFQSLEL